MKKLLLATAALLALTASSHALEISCEAPRVLLGDETFDRNPVVSVDITYVPEDHSWRVFHTLRNGLVVSRSEQYAIMDASNRSKIQWQGSLNRNRALYMVGEVRETTTGSIDYLEWIYDRSKNYRLTMHAVTHCEGTTASGITQPTS